MGRQNNCYARPPYQQNSRALNENYYFEKIKKEKILCLAAAEGIRKAARAVDSMDACEVRHASALHLPFPHRAFGRLTSSGFEVSLTDGEQNDIMTTRANHVKARSIAPVSDPQPTLLGSFARGTVLSGLAKLQMSTLDMS